MSITALLCESEVFSMPMSKAIRSRRVALGLTQEQLADALGVTAAAVSKWENDLSLPDMALLPVLARLLETDPNTLLGFAADPTRSEIAEILNRLCDANRQGGFDAALALARRKLREYPSSGLLAINVATVLDGLCASDPELRGRMQPEILSLYEKTAASPDETVARQAKTMLVLRYRDAGRYTEAQALLSELPGPVMPGKEQMQADLYCSQGQWAEAGRVTESWLLMSVAALVQALTTLVEVAAAEHRREDAAVLARKGRQMLELLGYPPYLGIHLELLAALKCRDKKQAMELFRQLSDAARQPVSAPVMRPFFCHLPEKPDGGQQAAEVYRKLFALLICRSDTDPDMAFLQDDPTFADWLAGVKAEFAAD